MPFNNINNIYMRFLVLKQTVSGAPTSIKDLLPSFTFTPMMQQQTKRAEKRDRTGKNGS